MRILSLELENVKSYTRAHIAFSEGLNAVCGHNGSGKSTVLEALGFALFDFLPYNQSAFIREGQKAATIRVRLTARDGREYEVVRKIGQGSGFYVSDPESSTRLAERPENVLEWVRTAVLGIEKYADLKALYKNAVGVPQGTMTADFLQAAGQRKAIFNPLLRVEEYDRAYEYLRGTSTFLKDRAGDVGQDIARLETETARLSLIAGEIAQLQTQLTDCERVLAGLGIELSEFQTEKSRMDELHTQVRDAENELRDVIYDVGRLRDAAQRAQAELDECLRARALADASVAGYTAATHAREVLATLEGQRRDRDAIDRDLAGVKAEMLASNGRLEGLDRQYRDKQKAERRAADLEPAVAQQTELESEQHELSLRLHGEVDLKRRRQRLQDDVTELQRQLTAGDERIRQAVEAQSRLRALGPLQERLRHLGGELARMEDYKGECDRLRRQGQELRSVSDQLAADARRREEIRIKIAGLQQDSDQLQNAQERQAAIREECVRIEATLEYQQIARSQLRNHHCPLLEVTCPVVSHDSSSLQRFEARVAVLDDRLPELEEELTQIDALVERGKHAHELRYQLQVEMAQLGEGAGKDLQVEAELAACRDEYRTTSAKLGMQAELEQEARKLSAEQDRFQSMAAASGTPEHWQEQQEVARSTLLRTEADRAELGRQLNALVSLRERQAAIVQALLELGDPRRVQTAQMAIAGGLQEMEQGILAEQRRLAVHGDRLKVLVARGQLYALLDQQLADQQRLAEQYQADYDMYLQNRGPAEQVEARERSLRDARLALQTAECRQLEAQNHVDALQSRYDSSRHAELAGRLDEVKEAIASSRRDRDHWSGGLQQKEAERAHLVRQQDKLRKAESERYALLESAIAVTFIRDTLKAAGPAITETMLDNISQTANAIYEEIMDDHASELRWTRDFEIVVQHGAEERNFAQLSGGEQMSGALAVRLALLKEMSDIDFAFFDEPTQNMDSERRVNLAQQIRAVKGFEQLIVISHDDTFEQHTDTLIRLRKLHGETVLDPG